MKLLKLLTYYILLLTVPLLAVYPQSDIPPAIANISSDATFWKALASQTISYDDILDLIDEIEDGEFEQRCSEDEIKRINLFIAFLAKQGVLPNEFGLESVLDDDIQELCGDSREHEYVAVPSVLYEHADAILCKSWIKKRWDRTRHFVKKHKTAIIIGAAVVVAVAVTVTVAVVACGAAAAASVAKGPKAPERMPPVAEPIAPKKVVAETPLLQEVIQDQIELAKDSIVQDLIHSEAPIINETPSSFGDKARRFGAHLAHKTLNEIADLGAIVPGLLQEIRDISSTVCSDTELPNHSPLGFYRDKVDAGHEHIDQLFGVETAHLYTTENREVGIPWTLGILPTPGAFGAAVATEGRIAATLANSTWGWSIGQPIQNRTIFGTVPSWSAVRRRYWKNKAEWAKSNPGHRYTESNIPRMEKGLAPIRKNKITNEIESMELHHTPPRREGGLFDFIEVWPDEHALVDKNRYIKGK